LKIVLLRDDQILWRTVVNSGLSPITEVAQEALSETFEKANVTRDQVDFLVSTGTHRKMLRNITHDQVPDALCCVRAISQLLPSTKTIVDIGTDKNLVVRCEGKKVLRTARSDRCAAGTGRYLAIVSNLLGTNIEKMGELSLQSRQQVNIESTCAVFVETEIISLIHKKYALEDIARAALRGWAHSLYPLLMEVEYKQRIAIVGGMASNVGILSALEELIEHPVLVPKEPIIVGALGAAKIAADRGVKS